MLRRPHRGLGTLLTACLLASTGAALSMVPAAAAAPAVSCAPKTVTPLTAPGIGNTQVVRAASAGNVKVQQQGVTALDVKEIDTAPGWTDTVLTGSGDRLHLTFDRIGSTHVVRFYARLNPTGTRLSVITVVCT
jgi:hypothetical protein